MNRPHSVYTGQPTKVGASVERVTYVTQFNTKARDVPIRRKFTFLCKRPNYWWNSELISLRSASHRVRGTAQRAEGRTDLVQKKQAFKEECKTLAIWRGKRECLNERSLFLQERVNPWMSRQFRSTQRQAAIE